MVFHLLLHSGGHHDDTDDGDQQEVEGVHDAGPRGLLDLGAAVTAAGAGRRAAAAGQLHTENNGGERKGGRERQGKTLPSLFRMFHGIINHLI